MCAQRNQQTPENAYTTNQRNDTANRIRRAFHEVLPFDTQAIRMRGENLAVWEMPVAVLTLT
jgi:hypothetical protein